MWENAGWILAALLIWRLASKSSTPGVDGAAPKAGGYRAYRVHGGFDDADVAADRLALLERRAALLLDWINHRYLFGKNEYQIDAVGAAKSKAADAARRLALRYSPDALAENAPGIDGTAYTLDKGQLIAMCLREAAPGAPLAAARDGYDPNSILLFVFLHELGHVASNEYGHGPEFWSTFKWILQEAVLAPGIGPDLVSMDFGARPTRYCGLKVDHNPLFDPSIVALPTLGEV